MNPAILPLKMKMENLHQKITGIILFVLDERAVGLSDNQRYITLGNCLTVPVIEYLLKHLQLYDNSAMKGCCV